MTEAPPTPALIAPPTHVVDFAVEVAGWSPCQSKRGVVIFRGDDILSHGYNYKPHGFECDGSNACKATCRVEAVHAEQQALLVAPDPVGADLLHVKAVNGQLVPSGGPSCVQCSKLALIAGIAGVWLYHDSGWRRYAAAEFHALSLRAAADALRSLTEDVRQLQAMCADHVNAFVEAEAALARVTQDRDEILEARDFYAVAFTKAELAAVAQARDTRPPQLGELITKWRTRAREDALYGAAQALTSHREYFGPVNAALAVNDCANELDAVLAALGPLRAPRGTTQEAKNETNNE